MSKATKAVSFKATKAEYLAFGRIVTRAIGIAARMGKRIDALSLTMDLSACHANGTPLDVDALLSSDDADFAHDVFGITRYIDRETGTLGSCFLPRCARKSSS